MTNNTIALKSIGGIDASSAESPEVISIDPDQAGNVLVKGTVEKGDKLVTCTLARPGWAQTQFAMADKYGNWSAQFDNVQPGTYLLSCCAEDEGSVCAEFQVPASRSRTVKPTLAVNTPINTTSTTVTVNGTVNISDNDVCCALTGPMGFRKTKTAIVTGTSWTVQFDRPSSSGSYMFTAAAVMEGTTGAQVML
jgi:hypothetical protein